MKIKYGKPYDTTLLKIKSEFYEENDRLLEEAERLNDIYTKQPPRFKCKMCGKSFGDTEKKFTSHGVEYIYCINCHHLNGAYEESIAFCEKLYVESNYGKTYNEKDREAYHLRVKSIYAPKMDFLLENLRDEMADKQIHILDVGTGSGYFVQAGLDAGIDIKGIEVSDSQVNFGNAMIGEIKINCISVSEVSHYVRNTTSNIVSMIGVLEHLVDFHEVMQAIQDNNNIDYVFFSVPMFSYSCIFETIFQEGFNRHMGAAHTHLFSLDSIAYMNQKYEFDEIARWQFGTDIMDLYRFLSIYLGKQGGG